MKLFQALAAKGSLSRKARLETGTGVFPKHWKISQKLFQALGKTTESFPTLGKSAANFPKHWKLLPLALLAAWPALAVEPFGDAVAVWKFDGADKTLTARGAVQLGVELAGEERAASLARGGDGKVAQFDGGHLEIGGLACDPSGAEFTLLLRVRDP
ncbi:MAG: hypothetical protein NTY53_07730, partial [Kiritimatiellaeota bacterium]|nr:hypothetical protein [Kiritimatiellota bacterium]